MKQRTLEHIEAKKQKKLKPSEGDKALTGREGVGIGEPAGCAGREDGGGPAGV